MAFRGTGGLFLVGEDKLTKVVPHGLAWKNSYSPGLERKSSAPERKFSSENITCKGLEAWETARFWEHGGFRSRGWEERKAPWKGGWEGRLGPACVSSETLKVERLARAR